MIIKPEIPFKTTEIHWEKSSRYVTISSQLQITASCGELSIRKSC